MPSIKEAALKGSDYSLCQPLKLTVNASGGSVTTTTTTMTAGSYMLLATCNALVAYGTSLTAPDGTQGTGTTGSFGVPAGVPVPLSMPTAQKLSCISVDASTGVLIITGPIYRGVGD